MTFSAVWDWFFYLSTYWLETCHKSSQCITEGYQADKKYPRCHGFSKYQLSLHSTLPHSNEWVGCEMEGKLIFWKSAALILQSDAFLSFRLSILWIMPSFKSICPEIKKKMYTPGGKSMEAMSFRMVNIDDQKNFFQISIPMLSFSHKTIYIHIKTRRNKHFPCKLSRK